MQVQLIVSEDTLDEIRWSNKASPVLEIYSKWNALFEVVEKSHINRVTALMAAFLSMYSISVVIVETYFKRWKYSVLSLSHFWHCFISCLSGSVYFRYTLTGGGVSVFAAKHC